MYGAPRSVGEWLDFFTRNFPHKIEGSRAISASWPPYVNGTARPDWLVTASRLAIWGDGVGSGWEFWVTGWLQNVSRCELWVTEWLWERCEWLPL
jgi:hypothetical protein